MKSVSYLLCLLLLSCSYEQTTSHTHPPLPPTVTPESFPMAEGQQRTQQARCPAGRLYVEGSFCHDAEERCAEWGTDSFMPGTREPLRCLRFSSANVCRVSSRRSQLRFCIDRYEYPNIEGSYPPVYVTWVQAQNLCARAGKRLCTSHEWTFACEGAQMNPYPYGLTRDATACNIDVNVAPNRQALANPQTREAELRRVYRAVPSGSMRRCVSPFGVHDMTGNVDEWVVNPAGNMDRPPFRSGLKGGYWGPVRTRCRPMTTIHGPGFDYYQISFRCCSNPQG